MRRGGDGARTRPRVGLGCIALALFVAGAACASNPAGGEPTTGGAVTYMLGTHAATLDPARVLSNSGGSDVGRLGAIYDPLIWADPRTGEVHPGLAKSLTTTDGSEWTLELRPGVTFTDGTPLNAEAVKFNYERIADTPESSVRAIAQSMRYEVVDDLTLRITPDEPNVALDKTIAYNMPYIGSPTAMRKHGENYSRHPVGAGPFMLEEWVQDDHITLVRNPDYWRKGRPYLDQVVITEILDIGQRVNSVISDDAQLTNVNTRPEMQRARSGGLVIEEVRSGGGGIIYFNTGRSPFDDPRARRAVVLALNLDELVQVAQADPEAAANGHLLPESSPFHDASAQIPQQDRAEAQRLFDELAAEGKPVDFVFSNLAGSEPNSRQAQYIQSKLSEFRNVSMEIETLDITAAAEKVFRNHNYDITVWPGPYYILGSDPELWDLLHTRGRYNPMQYSNPKVDAALERARSSDDESVRADAYARVQQEFMADLPLFFTDTARKVIMHSPDVTNVEFYNETTIFWDRIALRE